jgi:hypothetical protein
MFRKLFRKRWWVICDRDHFVMELTSGESHYVPPSFSIVDAVFRPRIRWNFIAVQWVQAGPFDSILDAEKECKRLNDLHKDNDGQ